MINKILQILNDKLKIELSIDKELQKKTTARSLKKYILKDKKCNKYLLEIALNNIEKFYFKRTIEFQKKFSKLKHSFKLNIPIFKQSGNKYSFSLYKYFENIKFLKNDLPVKLLKEFYKNNVIDIELNEENIQKILNNFLLSYPPMYHSMIKRQKEYRLYKKELEKYKTIKVSFEHGDFNGENIALINNNVYLLDFEFSREFQPIEFDIYDYYKLKKEKNIDVIYYNLHKIKYKFIDKINNKIDEDATLEIYKEIDEDATLEKNWKKLYKLGANYNLSIEWCQTWWKYYKNDNRELFVFTIWNDEELVLLVPLYKEKNRLFLIGTDPDLYDSFDILYKDDKYIRFFLEYIFKKGYQIEFKYLESDTIFAKSLIKFLYQKKISYLSDVIDTKPKVIFNDLWLKTKEKSDIKRCKNKALKKYNKELNFIFKIDKNNEELNTLINIHKNRWNGGPFEVIKNFENFIKDISQTDIVIISKLYIDDIIFAYHLGYLDSYGILNSAIPSYSNKYNDISPGKILLYEILEHSQNKGDKVFDFGRGAERYKYWFANESSILFHIKSIDNKKFLPKMQNFINRVFNKIIRSFNV